MPEKMRNDVNLGFRVMLISFSKTGIDLNKKRVKGPKKNKDLGKKIKELCIKVRLG